MSTFKRITSGKHTLLPVIHVEGGAQARRNIEIARDAGADGVFLINHEIPYTSLFECYESIRSEFPDFWIGLNCLDLGRSAIEFIPKSLNGLWVDNVGIDEKTSTVTEAYLFDEKRHESGWNGLYFGGVAFKYQPAVDDVAKAALLAMVFADVITTSGSGTGQTADINKIKLMKKAIGAHPLAIASGIAAENVRDYMPYVSCFLVATGISDSHTELNPKKVRALAKILHS